MPRETALTPEEVLNIALAKERASFRYYERLLNQTTTEWVADLLQDLKNQEYKHIRTIERRLEQLRRG